MEPDEKFIPPPSSNSPLPARGFRVFVLFIFVVAFIVPLAVVLMLLAKGRPKWIKPKPAPPQSTNAVPTNPVPNSR